MSRDRLLALLGVVPLGMFVFVHLVAASTAMSGASRFDRVFASSPVLTALTLLVVVVPFVAHAAWGTWVALRQPRAMNLPAWLPGWRRSLSLVVLLFVVGHVVELPLRRWTGGLQADALFDVMTSHLSSTWHSLPPVALAYLVGTAATLLHLGTSMWGSLRSSGVLLANRTTALVKWGLVAVGSLLFLLSASTVLYLATGTRLLSSPPPFVPDGPPSSCSPKT